MTQLSNETISERTATLLGAAIMLLEGLIEAEPGVVFATGFAMAQTGLALSCFPSTREIRHETRLHYSLLWVTAPLALVAVTGWVVWDYTSTVMSFSAVIALALLSYATVYFLTRTWLRAHRKPVGCAGDESTE